MRVRVRMRVQAPRCQWTSPSHCAEPLGQEGRQRQKRPGTLIHLRGTSLQLGSGEPWHMSVSGPVSVSDSLQDCWL